MSSITETLTATCSFLINFVGRFFIWTWFGGVAVLITATAIAIVTATMVFIGAKSITDLAYRTLACFNRIGWGRWRSVDGTGSGNI